MPYLKKVTINNNEYYYLFHTVRDKDKFRKVSKYIGKEIPKDIEKIKKEFLAEIKKQPKPVTVPDYNVVQLLQDLQEKEGYLSKEAMIKLSKEMNIPAVFVCGVATFYSMFKLKKLGKYKISICSGTACHVKNSFLLLNYLEGLLGVKVGETTQDHKFTLEAVNCIGACAKAPAMMINDEVYGELTKGKVKKIIEELNAK